MGPGEATVYGVTTVGVKGQIVIPAEAREDFGLQPGEKVIIIGRKNPHDGHGIVAICPIDVAEHFVNAMATKVSEMQSALDKASKKA
jgi:AbrB family looped-hinge helix DNA binding protein